MTGVYCDTDAAFSETLRKSLRGTAVNISLLTTRDPEGRYHGLAVTTAVPFSSHLPSMIVAVSHAASAYPAIRDSQMYCLNQITSKDIELLDKFSRSDLRASRFTNGTWRAGLGGLPYLATATASFFCSVATAQSYEDQTVFIGRIDGVRLADGSGAGECDPLIWINGGPAKLAGRAYA
ncbi:NADH-FMN oxidoreductase RutF, flavin reductase (DIM6/NTAB) family [Gemmobacter aquatilis]|uniref:NADH-FMN oxidoreductase RutF, flavin reductase (DIM6/NTAB) family n=1 Tax=Gemmobacter aquatilis TaxID=933059 RepID=A0A1H8MD90_9RHOB|nr:NADH-FMN oxidoreductase RutF, flavin reductase (DIM6/NTAB) family [Gemmobacter aquatilis]